MPIEYTIDINVDIFDFDFYGKTAFFPKHILKKGHQDDFIPFNKDLHQKYLNNQLRVWPELDSQTCDRITNVIIKYWDLFCKEGAQRPILGYKFTIDNDTAKPVFCLKPKYGTYESKIIMSQI